MESDEQTEPQPERPATVTISAEDYAGLCAAADQHLTGTNARLNTLADMILQIRHWSTRATDLASLERQMTAVLVGLEMINAELRNPMERIREIDRRSKPPGFLSGNLPSGGTDGS